MYVLEEFCYSYAQNFTQHIPRDYPNIGAYVDITQDIVYVYDAVVDDGMVICFSGI